MMLLTKDGNQWRATMGDKSKIEWTDATWPIFTGCTKYSLGCLNCYAAREAATRLRNHPRYNGLAVKMGKGRYSWTSEVRFNIDLVDQLDRWRKPRMVFVCPSSDFFHRYIGRHDRGTALSEMISAGHHTYQILTKRSSRMSSELEFHFPYGAPEHIWFGVSVEAAEYRHRARLLRKANVHFRFLSLEPLLERIPDCEELVHGMDWVIIGGESEFTGLARPLPLAGVEEIINTCTRLGIPVFVKQMGSYWAQRTGRFKLGDKKGSNMEYWPEGFRIREWPLLYREWPLLYLGPGKAK